jgi:serine/threonine protein kinase
MDPVAGTIVGGKYRLDRPLARGGMGAVWAGHHLRLDVPIAVKFMAAGSDRTGRARFEREARAAASLRSPHVVQVLDYDAAGEQPYIVMELLEGQDLGHRLNQRGRLSLEEVIVIVRALATGLTLAHDAGIVHRDLKLDNVFLCATPFADGRRVKLLDWGVAYVAGEEDPFRGLIAGTLTYVAPEQIRGDGLSGATDIYSLAVLAYHLLCRRPPFAGPDLQLLHMHLRSEPPPPRIAWPDVPTEIDSLLVRMLAKHPEDRPSLDEVEDTLRAMLGIVEQPMRFAEGSAANIAIPPANPDEPVWCLRWLKARSASPHVVGDVLGRPMLPAPPFKAAWIGIGLALAALASLASALP